MQAPALCVLPAAYIFKAWILARELFTLDSGPGHGHLHFSPIAFARFELARLLPDLVMNSVEALHHKTFS